MGDNEIEVGEYTQRFNDLTGQTIPCGKIYQFPGLQVHVQNHHPDKTSYISDIPDIIANPDYVGHNPKEGDSIELVKKYMDHEMVCIKLDSKKGYLYVASVYEITEAKLNNRVNSGRLKKY